jgi:acyl-CoA thioester hydrolase
MLSAENSLVFVVHRMEIDFKSPARMDDVVSIRTITEKAAGAKLILDQVIRREDTLLIVARVIVAVINARGRPQRLPPALVQQFAAISGS